MTSAAPARLHALPTAAPRTSPDPAESGFEAWEHQICRTFVPLRARHDDAPFAGAVRSATLGAVMLAEVTASHAVVERTPRLIRQDDPELYKFALQTSGSCVIEQDDRQARLQPGDLAIYDTSRPYRIGFDDDFRMTIAMFPRALVHLPAARMARLTAVRLAGDQGLAALLTPLMRGLSAQVSDAGGVMAMHLGDAVVDLVTAAFAEQLGQGPTEEAPAHRALALQVHRHIERHLADPDLSTRSIAAAHFVSVRHLQKVFEGEGESVTAFIRRRRLEQCRRDLVDPHLSDRPIAGIGARWGFLDAAHFSRLFRGTFGMSPRGFRALHGATRPS
ncbi:MAG: helix-turn-helix domain-containing protein [Marmoricola sp.]